MEQILQEILAGQKCIEQRLGSLEEGQNELKAGQARLETDVAGLKAGQAKLIVGQKDHQKQLKYVWKDILRLDNRLTSQGADIDNLKSVK